MFDSEEGYSKLYQVVIITCDYGLNARLQQCLQQKKIQSIGFYYVDDAIEWEKSHGADNLKIFIVDDEVNGRSWQETLRAFHANDLMVDSLILIKPGDDVPARDIRLHGANAVISKDENLYNNIPGLLDDILATIESEKKQSALSQTTRHQKPAGSSNKYSYGKPDNHEDVSEDVSLFIDEEKSNDEQINELKKLQHQLEESKNEFVALTSYLNNEIRESVNTAIANARSLEKSNLSKEQKRLLNSMMSAAGKQLWVLRNMLDYSKIKSNDLEVVYHNFHLRAMTNEVMAAFEQQSEENKALIKLNINENVPDYVYGDKKRIQQVIINVIALALKPSIKKCTEMSVDLSSNNSKNDQLVFTIQSIENGDKINAPSLNPDEESLFVSDAIDISFGLKLVRGLVELMGGEFIKGSDTADFGRVVFSIPLFEVSIADVSEGFDRGYGDYKQHLKILLAEDDVINQLYLSGFLRSQGWEVDTAYNGLAVMELYEPGKYDLIILDGQMPGLNGFDTARKIRLSEPVNNRIPILAISGYAIPGDKQKFLDAGMDDYLPKPINEDELLKVIRKLTVVK